MLTEFYHPRSEGGIVFSSLASVCGCVFGLFVNAITFEPFDI